MAHEWQPGMEMYEAVWERDGEVVLKWFMPAVNEQDVIAKVEKFFAEHPEYEVSGSREGAIVQVTRWHPADRS